MNIYVVYGLRILSDIPFPELLPVEGTEYDVRIQIGKMDDFLYKKAKTKNGWYYDEKWGFFSSYEKAGLFCVRNEQNIIVDPMEGAEDLLVRAILLSPVLNVLLHVRGNLVMHASTVSFRNKAISFVGESGWGKSTMAAAFCKLGGSLVSDDVAAIQFPRQGQPVVTVGIPQFKLWPNVLEAFGENPEQLPLVQPELVKRTRPTAQAELGVYPLTTMYILGYGPSLSIETLPPRQAFAELLQHSYCSKILSLMGSQNHLQQCGELINQVQIKWLTRPRCLESVHDVANKIIEDVYLNGE